MASLGLCFLVLPRHRHASELGLCLGHLIHRLSTNHFLAIKGVCVHREEAHHGSGSGLGHGKGLWLPGGLLKVFECFG